MLRASLIGLNVYLLRLIAFVMAGFLAGVAGALFAFFGRYASATYMFYQVSGEAVVWAIVGGAGTLFGPIVGTSLFIVHPRNRLDALGAPFADRRRVGDPRRDRRAEGLGRVFGATGSIARALARKTSLKPCPGPSRGPSHERADPAHRASDEAIRRSDGGRRSQPRHCRAGNCTPSSGRTAPARRRSST